MKTFIPLLLILPIILISGCTQNNTVDETNKETGISMEEVAQHDSSDDCWMVIDNSVYDVTDFVSSHPGGNAILQGCGTDATMLFEMRPMGSGTSHSSLARGLLPDYYIGELA